MSAYQEQIGKFTVEEGEGKGDYVVYVEPDQCMGAPWDEHDGHGDVSDWTSRAKEPGERVLSSDRGSFRYYDYAGAIKKAKSEGWGLPPEEAKGLTRKQVVAAAVERDFKHLRGWCNDDWCWIVICVKKVCPCCGEVKDNGAAYLGGVESGDLEYIMETAKDMAGEVE